MQVQHGNTHSGLNHLHALLPHLDYDTRHIHQLLLLCHLKDYVNGYECSCPTHTSTEAEMHKYSTNWITMHAMQVYIQY